MRIYVVTPYYNRLCETVLMMCHKICFFLEKYGYLSLNYPSYPFLSTALNLDKVGHYEPPHQDLCCLQIQIKGLGYNQAQIYSHERELLESILSQLSRADNPVGTSTLV